MSMRHWCAKIFLLVGIILAGCDANVKVGNFDNDRASALDRVEEFRRLISEQNYAELYELGAPAMKSALTREQFIAALQATTVQFGKYKSSTLVGTSCFPNEVRLLYHSEFEKEKVTERMVWSVPKDKAILVHYQVYLGHEEFKKESQIGCPS